MSSTPQFRGGRNIAMKVPSPLWQATVEFYRDVLGLKEIPGTGPSVSFEFGANRLWIDREDRLSQSEIWLEINADDLARAADHFAAAGVVRRDEIEPLPDGFAGFWIQSPASIVHLVSQTNP